MHRRRSRMGPLQAGACSGTFPSLADAAAAGTFAGQSLLLRRQAFLEPFPVWRTQPQLEPLQAGACCSGGKPSWNLSQFGGRSRSWNLCRPEPVFQEAFLEPFPVWPKQPKLEPLQAGACVSGSFPRTLPSLAEAAKLEHLQAGACVSRLPSLAEAAKAGTFAGRSLCFRKLSWNPSQFGRSSQSWNICRLEPVFQEAFLEPFPVWSKQPKLEDLQARACVSGSFPGTLPSLAEAAKAGTSAGRSSRWNLVLLLRHGKVLGVLHCSLGSDKAWVLGHITRAWPRSHL